MEPQLHNETIYEALVIPFLRDKVLEHSIIVKATFSIIDRTTVEREEAQLPIQDADLYLGDSLKTSVRY